MRVVYQSGVYWVNLKIKDHTLQMCSGVFPAIYMEKGCKNHRETLYSSVGKILYGLEMIRSLSYTTKVWLVDWPKQSQKRALIPTPLFGETKKSFRWNTC